MIRQVRLGRFALTIGILFGALCGCSGTSPSTTCNGNSVAGATGTDPCPSTGGAAGASGTGGTAGTAGTTTLGGGQSNVGGTSASTSATCNCQSTETCLDGTCRPSSVVCSPSVPNGLCGSGFDCVVGVCVDKGAGCTPTNPSGICPIGQVCTSGACVAVNEGALCDDANACTRDYFDYGHNRCAHEAQQATCSDGNACTTDVCSNGVCNSTAIAGCLTPPTINAYTTPTNNPTFILGGTKPAGSAIKINGSTAVNASPPATWSVTRNLDPGVNTFVISSVAGSVESATVQVSITYDNVPPVTSMSPAGGVYLSGVTVTVATNEPATVYYTTDGGTPDQYSQSFQSVKQFSVFDDTVLRFLSQDAAGNWETSEVKGSFEITGQGNGWHNGPVLAGPRLHAASAFLNGVVYLAGGSDGAALQAGAFSYNLSTDTWSTLPDLPGTLAARAEHSMVALGGKLYVVGGRNSNAAPLAGVAVFDPTAKTWATDTAMLTTRYGLAVVPYNGKLYAFGGKTNGGVVLTALEVFTPGTPGSWSNSVLAMPRPRYAFGAVESGGKIYLVGGETSDGTPIAEMDIYDPTANTWSQGPSMPTPRSFLAVGLNQNRGKVTGGYSGVVAAGGRGKGGASQAIVEEFVIDDNRWRERTPLAEPRLGAAAVSVDDTGVTDSVDRQIWMIGGQTPVGVVSSSTYFTVNQDYVRRLADSTPRFGHAAAALNGRIYLFGGRDFSEKVDAWVFDPVTERFDAISPLPTIQNEVQAVALADRVYAIGGVDENGFSVPTMRAFDPVLGTWQELTPMPTARRSAAVAYAGNQIYVIGGAAEGQAKQTVEIYDVTSNVWTSGPALPTEGRMGAKAVAYHGSIYVFGGQNTAGAATSTILRLNAGAWTTVTGTIPDAYGSVSILGDSQVTLFSGLSSAALTNQRWSYDIAGSRLFPPLSVSLLAPYDLSASAIINGKVYIFGGNATASPAGPGGQVLVQKVEGRCFNGIRDGRESGTDSGGGCSPIITSLDDSFATSTLDPGKWLAPSGDWSVDPTYYRSAPYALNLGGGAGTAEAAPIDTSICTNVTYDIWVKRGPVMPYYNYLYLEYYNGSAWASMWSLYGSYTLDPSFIHYTGTAPADAKRANLRLRFRTTAYNGTGYDDFYVDDVSIGCQL